jgi:hypothetical protein
MGNSLSGSRMFLVTVMAVVSLSSMSNGGGSLIITISIKGVIQNERRWNLYYCYHFFATQTLAFSISHAVRCWHHTDGSYPFQSRGLRLPGIAADFTGYTRRIFLRGIEYTPWGQRDRAEVAARDFFYYT